MVHPPKTIMEVFKMLPEGTLAEVIENTLYMSPTPTGNHQRVSRLLLTQIDQHVTSHDLGEMFGAPFDVYLNEDANAVQPDLFFIAKKNLGIFDPKGHIHGIPDLVIEILSPGNRKHDEVIKKNLYEKFGVKEYWIVDPDTREFTGFTLSNQKFALIEKSTGTMRSILLNETFQI